MTEDAADETPPVACTLDREGYDRRAPRIESELLPRLAEARQLEDGVELTFEGADETVAAVARFVREESTCCSFARYELAVEPRHERTTLAITGPEGTAELFREGFLAGLDELPDAIEDLPAWFDERHAPT